MKKFEFRRKTKSTITKPFYLDQTIVRFLDAKRLQKRSDRTIKTYDRALKHFTTYCNNHGLNGADDASVTAYIRYISFEKVKWDDHPTSKSSIVGVSPRSVNNAIRFLRVFYNWAVAQKLISHNPAESIGIQKEPDNGFELFTDDEVKQLLNAPNHRTYTGFRDYVMMLILTDTGIRVSELTSLKRGDFELQYRQIII
ncbi:phage integrase N-terminal SAM-like domain-containing protein [Psychrobacillus sp. INOP01]|nr:phage integrase N-terminal SAM-like domain-containing protein [Psychrobacillus sp. INOP01]